MGVSTCRGPTPPRHRPADRGWAVSDAHLLVILAVASVTLVAVAALRRLGVPAPVSLVCAGLVIGFLPFVPDVVLQPDVALYGLLPLLVFDAAVTSSPTGFVRQARSIGTLAVALVVATGLAVAAVAHWLGQLDWPIAMVLGAAVGPTDASAATSVARRLGLPRRLVTIIEGEALFNDATALVLYAAAVAAATSGRFSATATVARIGWSVLGGVVIGSAVGVVGRWLRNRVDDPPIEIVGSILLAYAAYLPAQAAGASGVLAAVTAGLYLGWHASGGALSARSRLQSQVFWETLVFLVNATLFVLVGLSFHPLSTVTKTPAGRLGATAVAVVVTVVALRLVWMWAFGWLVRPAGDTPGGRRAGPERLILGWSGMRGAITLAALLAVPTAGEGGRPLPGRDDIVFVGFAVILVTLVGQGLTLPALVRRLRLPENPSVADAEQAARVAITQAALDHLDQLARQEHLPGELFDALRAQYQGRLHRLRSEPDDGESAEDHEAAVTAERAVRRAILDAQRRTLLDLRGRRRLGTTTLRMLERDLDLEEARLRQG